MTSIPYKIHEWNHKSLYEIFYLFAAGMSYRSEHGTILKPCLHEGTFVSIPNQHYGMDALAVCA